MGHSPTHPAPIPSAPTHADTGERADLATLGDPGSHNILGPGLESVPTLPTTSPASESLPLGVQRDAASHAATKQPSDLASAPGINAGEFTRVAGALVLVLMLIAILAAAYRRLGGRSAPLAAAMRAGGPSPAGILEILGRYPLGRGVTLILLRLDRRVLLVSQSAAGRLGRNASLSTLCELTDTDDVASVLRIAALADVRSPAGRFRAAINRFAAQHGDASLDTPDDAPSLPDDLTHDAVQQPDPADDAARHLSTDPVPASEFDADPWAVRQDLQPSNADPREPRHSTDPSARLRQRLERWRAKGGAS